MADEFLEKLNEGLPAHRKVPVEPEEEPPSEPTDRPGFVTIRITAFSQVKMPFVTDRQVDRIVAGLKGKARPIKFQSRGWNPIYTVTKPATAFLHKDRRITIEVDIPESYKVFLDHDRRNYPRDVEWIDGWDDMFSDADKSESPVQIVKKADKP